MSNLDAYLYKSRAETTQIVVFWKLYHYYRNATCINEII